MWKEDRMAHCTRDISKDDSQVPGLSTGDFQVGSEKRMASHWIQLFLQAQRLPVLLQQSNPANEGILVSFFLIVSSVCRK